MAHSATECVVGAEKAVRARVALFRNYARRTYSSLYGKIKFQRHQHDACFTAG